MWSVVWSVLVSRRRGDPRVAGDWSHVGVICGQVGRYWSQLGACPFFYRVFFFSADADGCMVEVDGTGDQAGHVALVVLYFVW